jgi:hypothetical protein
MANKSDRINPMFKATDRSTSAERRDKAIFISIEKERAETDAKTARLRALRLEKEAAEAAEALLNPPAKKTRARPRANAAAEATKS